MRGISLGCGLFMAWAIMAPVSWEGRQDTAWSAEVENTTFDGPPQIGTRIRVGGGAGVPFLQWHTFHGSTNSDDAYSTALDSAGNLYLAGRSYAPWGNPIHDHSGGADIVVVKLNRYGVLQWHTFYGSGDFDYGYGIAVSGNGEVYVTGMSMAEWGSPLHGHSGMGDLVVLKLDSSGAYQWHTFYGSGSADYGYGIAASGTGEEVYVTGESQGAWGSPVNDYSGGSDLVVLKLNGGGAYQWHTFHGSGDYDYGYKIALSGGDVFLTGVSRADWGTPVHGHQGGDDILVLKLDSGGAYQWHTFQGSADDDYGEGIAAGGGEVYVAADSKAGWGTPLTGHSGDQDIAVMKLNGSGALQWHTFFGSAARDSANSIALGDGGEIYVVGSSSGAWGNPLNAYTGGSDIIILQLDGSGTLAWHAFFGGPGEEIGSSLTAGGKGNVYVTGYATSTWGIPVNPYSGGVDLIALNLAPYCYRYLPLIFK